MKQAKEEGLKSFRIGKKEECCVPWIDAEWIIDTAQELLYNEVGESSEGYLDSTTKEQYEDLEEMLNEAFYKWHKKHGLFPSCYKVVDIETIEVK